MKIFKKINIKRVILITLGLPIIGLLSILLINGYVKASVSKNIIEMEEAKKLSDVDCILVLGCMVWGEDTPSHMLEDRLINGVALYEGGAAPKLLMSGDHGRNDYNEVGAMKKYATEHNVPSEDVFMDHAGFSTYESIYRAKEIFEADKIIIVTQDYHLYRALYIAKQLGIEAYGVAAVDNTYVGQTGRDIREVLARVKDIGYCIVKPKPTYLGDKIPIIGDGNVTND